MVFSDDFLHFLKIKKKNCWIHQNYIVALIWVIEYYVLMDEYQIVIILSIKAHIWQSSECVLYYMPELTKINNTILFVWINADALCLLIHVWELNLFIYASMQTFTS